MTLQVIGAGWGRTGTYSTKLMLERLLGAPCYHMREVAPGDHAMAEPWVRAANGETVDWATVFKGYAATVDWPGAAFWKELHAAYPDALVLLNDRDPGEWFASYWRAFGESFASMAEAGGPEAVNEIGPDEWRKRLGWSVIVQKSLGVDPRSAAAVRASYRRHVAEVKRVVPKDRLLVWNPSMGWGPLCDALGVERVKGAVPWVNRETAMDLGRLWGQFDEAGDLVIATASVKDAIPEAAAPLNPDGSEMTETTPEWGLATASVVAMLAAGERGGRDDEGIVWKFTGWETRTEQEPDGLHHYVKVTVAARQNGKPLPGLSNPYLLEVPTVDLDAAAESIVAVLKSAILGVAREARP